MAKRRKKKKKYGFLVIILLLIAAVTLALTTPFFNIKSVTVEGVSRLLPEEIKAAALIPEGDNIFRTNLEKAKNRVAAIPFVDTVNIGRKFPDRIVIQIVEGTVSGYIPNGETMLGIDKKGKILESVPLEGAAGITVIYGTEISEANLGQKVVFTDTGLIDIMAMCLEKFEEYGISGDIISLDIGNRMNIQFATAQGLEVALGDMSEIDYKLKLYTNVVEKGYTVGVLNVSNTAQPTYRKNK